MQAVVTTDIRRQLVDAPDLQLSQVVALVDAMPVRGAADALIAPLRARLASIAPMRQLSLSRLLFKPLDAVILPASRWRRGIPAIPRTALAPIAAACLAQLVEVSAAVRTMIAGRACTEAAAINAGGLMLWPAAAGVLDTLPVPPDWLATGLAEHDYAPIRAALAVVLHQACTLETCRIMARGPALATAIRVMLSAAGVHGPATSGVLMAVLLADSALAAAATAAGVGGPAAEAAAELTLNHADHVIQTLLPALGLASATTQAAKIGALLSALEGQSGPPGQRARVLSLRQAADVACQSRLAQAVSQDLLPKVRQAGGSLSDSEMTGLEGVARGLRRLATAGRQFGGGAAADRLLDNAAAEIAAEAPVLSPMDRLRLVELLSGSAAAVEFAARGGPGRRV